MKKASPAELAQEAMDALEIYGNKAAAARALGIPRTTLRARIAAGQSPPEVELPRFPTGNLDAEEVLDHMERASDQMSEQQQALHWFDIKIHTDRPIGICWFGDPHLGSNGQNVGQLRADISVVAETDGLYGANIGDTTDNWGGRLLRLYAENDVSKKTERLLATWFLVDAGIDWLLWLEGNHDHMDESFVTHLRAINGNRIPMIDWRAKFKLVFSNGVVVKVDAAHDHKGHSMWNELHAQVRAALMEEHADLFVAGHRHNSAHAQIELPTGQISTLLRVKGYKGQDSFAQRHNYAPRQHGAAVVTVINPQANSPTGRIMVFPDVAQGAEYLTWLRS